MDNGLMAVLLFIALAALLFFLPLALWWAIEVLFPVVIPIGWQSWAATWVLLLLLGTKVSSK